MDIKNFTSSIAQIAEEKGISPEKVIETIEMAIAAAYKKDYGKRGQIIKAKLDSISGGVKFWQIKLAVDENMIYSESELLEEAKLKKGTEASSPAELSRMEAKAEKKTKFSSTEELEEMKKKFVSSADAPMGRKEGEEDIEEGRKVRFNPEKHVMLEEAKKINKTIKPGDTLEIPLVPREDYGRIAAQTAKQVILQRIREAERESILAEYKSKEGEVISGIVQRMEGRNVFLDLGKTIGILPREEQVPGEFYRLGQRLKVYVLKIEETSKGPVVFLSRAYPKIISKLFELEVPEVSSEQVLIKSIAREVGSRSKIAVATDVEGIDPIGSMVGQRGTRVMAVINELGGEKIDIIEYSPDPGKYIANALSPAKVLEVKIMPKNKALVVVPEDQLSLAIGKEGQNVRLAAKLTGWKIDVRAPEKAEEQEEEKKEKEKPAAKTKSGAAKVEKKKTKDSSTKKQT